MVPSSSSHVLHLFCEQERGQIMIEATHRVLVVARKNPLLMRGRAKRALEIRDRSTPSRFSRAPRE